MSIALPTLLIVAALVPGISFLNAFYSGRFPRQLTALSPLVELSLYFLWALPIDALALRLIGIEAELCAYDIASQLFGTGPRNVHSQHAADTLSLIGWIDLTVWFFCLVLAAALLGALARRLVWAMRLDTAIPLLRLKAEWYYLVTGRQWWRDAEYIIPQVDVMVEHPGDSGTRLYAGVVAGVEPTKDGELGQLVLKTAERYSKGPEGKHLTKPIPGDAFAVVGSSIRSINMRYFRIQASLGTFGRVGWLAGDVWRALIEG